VAAISCSFFIRLLLVFSGIGGALSLAGSCLGLLHFYRVADMRYLPLAAFTQKISWEEFVQYDGFLGGLLIFYGLFGLGLCSVLISVWFGFCLTVSASFPFSQTSLLTTILDLNTVAIRCMKLCLLFFGVEK